MPTRAPARSPRFSPRSAASAVAFSGAERRPRTSRRRRTCGCCGRAPPEGADARTVLAWLYRTATRLAIDALRERRRTDAPADGAGGDAVGALPCGIDAAACLEARRAIAVLSVSVPADELEAAVLCRVDGLPHPEAAQVLGVSERTVRRMLERFDERTAVLRKELAS